MRKVLCICSTLVLLAIFALSSTSMAQQLTADLTIVSARLDATPTTISRLPMVQDDSYNSDLLLLTNLGTSSAVATINVYSTSGERTSVTTNIGAKSFYFASISDITRVRGTFSLVVEAYDPVYGVILTGPRDFHSISFRELWREPLGTATRTINVPLIAHYVWASGEIFLTNFADASGAATVTLYNLATGARVVEREFTLNAHALRRVPITELIGTGQEGLFSATISAPGTILGVFTVTDPDYDKGYYPLK